MSKNVLLTWSIGQSIDRLIASVLGVRGPGPAQEPAEAARQRLGVARERRPELRADHGQPSHLVTEPVSLQAGQKSV